MLTTIHHGYVQRQEKEEKKMKKKKKKKNMSSSYSQLTVKVFPSKKRENKEKIIGIKRLFQLILGLKTSIWLRHVVCIRQFLDHIAPFLVALFLHNVVFYPHQSIAIVLQ